MKHSYMLKKDTIKEYVVPGILFVASFLNVATLSVWLLGITVVGTYRRKVWGAVDALLFIQFRSIINPGIAVNIGNVAILKWMCIFLVSIYILIHGWNNKKSGIIQRVEIIFMLFSCVLIIFSTVNSSYPVVAVFKIWSWIIPFLAIIKGIAITSEYSWIKRVNVFLGLLMINSVFVLPLSVGYLRNGRSFQGLINHPNVFATMMALFMAAYLYIHNEKLTLKTIIIAIFSSVMIYFSKSRTGMITLLVVILIYVVSSDLSRRVKTLTISVLIISSIFIGMGDGGAKETVLDFLFKGGDTITASREGQIERNLARFYEHPFVGTGFNVPYTSGITSYSFSFDLVTENGNLILALLGDIGIIGLIAFGLCYGYIWYIGRGTNSTIFWAPFIVSMGEMTFFSTNNFAIFMYFFFAIYLNGRKREDKI